ncbi:MAG TPA: SapB/AmfS family lanthipeptide [Microlunatus sp.]|nr:SapB/AmfS family lanthipeptide [Microlunatus sp.]
MTVLNLQALSAKSATRRPAAGGGSSSLSIVCCNG